MTIKVRGTAFSSVFGGLFKLTRALVFKYWSEGNESGTVALGERAPGFTRNIYFEDGPTTGKYRADDPGIDVTINKERVPSKGEMLPGQKLHAEIPGAGAIDAEFSLRGKHER